MTNGALGVRRMTAPDVWHNVEVTGVPGSSGTSGSLPGSAAG